MYDVTDLLQNLYCYTFGSPYNPSRNYIPKSIQHFVNSNNIANYIFKDDVITKYDNGTPPGNLYYNTWVKDQCRLEKWALPNCEDPLEIHFSYNVLDTILHEGSAATAALKILLYALLSSWSFITLLAP